MREVKYTSRFKRDYRREQSGPHGKKLDTLLMDVVNLLAADKSLPRRNFDHLQRSFLGRTWHPGRVAGLMPHSMNDDFGFCGFIKNEIGIGRRREATDGGIICASADVGMKQEKVDNSLNADLNALGSLR
jgi:mRNA-degrading endonuclease YafQ of YafQ-DinJ toxin-antitoxin module